MVRRENEATMSSSRVRSTDAWAWRTPARGFTFELNLFFFRLTLNKSPQVRSQHVRLGSVAKYHSVSKRGNPRVVFCNSEIENLQDIVSPGLRLGHDSVPEIIFLVHLQRNRTDPYIHGRRSFRQIETVLLGTNQRASPGFPGFLLDLRDIGRRIVIVVAKKRKAHNLKAPFAQVCYERTWVAYSAKSK